MYTWEKNIDKSLISDTQYWVYCGGTTSEDNFLFNHGITDIRNGNGVIYKVPYNPDNHRLYGPYLQGEIGTYQIDYWGSNFTNFSDPLAYNLSDDNSDKYYAISDYRKTDNHIEAFINVNVLPTSSNGKGHGIEFAILNPDNTINIPDAALTRRNDIFITTDSYQGQGIAFFQQY